MNCHFFLRNLAIRTPVSLLLGTLSLLPINAQLLSHSSDGVTFRFTWDPEQVVGDEALVLQQLNPHTHEWADVVSVPPSQAFVEIEPVWSEQILDFRLVTVERREPQPSNITLTQGTRVYFDWGRPQGFSHQIRYQINGGPVEVFDVESWRSGYLFLSLEPFDQVEANVYREQFDLSFLAPPDFEKLNKRVRFKWDSPSSDTEAYFLEVPHPTEGWTVVRTLPPHVSEVEISHAALAGSIIDHRLRALFTNGQSSVITLSSIMHIDLSWTITPSPDIGFRVVMSHTNGNTYWIDLLEPESRSTPFLWEDAWEYENVEVIAVSNRHYEKLPGGGDKSFTINLTFPRSSRSAALVYRRDPNEEWLFHSEVNGILGSANVKMPFMDGERVPEFAVWRMETVPPRIIGNATIVSYPRFLDELNVGWYRSKALGWTRNIRDDWAYSTTFGFVFVDESGPFLFLPSAGWHYVASVTGPHILLLNLEANRWIYANQAAPSFRQDLGQGPMRN